MMAKWRVTTRWSVRHFDGADPEINTIPRAIYQALFLARVFNLDVLVEVCRSGKWVNIFNWPARRMRKPNTKLSDAPRSE